MTKNKSKSLVFLRDNALFVTISSKYFKGFRVNFSVDLCHHTATILSDLEGLLSIDKSRLTNPCKSSKDKKTKPLV